MEHNHEKLMEELLRGRNFANWLRDRLGSESLGHEALTSQQDLVGKILDTFKNSLSMLMDRPVAYDELDGRRSEDSGDSLKSSAHKDRRGCYKRRKGSHSWTREHSTPIIDDGRAWRKYGQKKILDCKHPRSYFRCTHKFDQGCQATKQVQRIEEDPVRYRTTYYGDHTCRINLLKNAPGIILESDSTDHSSILLSFGADHPTPTNNNSYNSPPETCLFSSVKQENEPCGQSSSASDYLLPSDGLTATFEFADYHHVESAVFDDVLDQFAFDDEVI